MANHRNISTNLTDEQLAKLADGSEASVVIHSVLRTNSGGLLVHYTRSWTADWINKGQPNHEERAAFINAEGKFRSGIFCQ